MSRPDPIRPSGPAAAEDDALLCAVRDGDGAAFDELYRRHAETLFTTAWHLLGDRADAEDVVHDLFLELPFSLKTFVPQGRGSAWLRTCARRLALMRLRTARRRPTRPLEGALHLVTETDSSTSAATALAWRLIGRLPASLRAVVTLRMLEDCTHAEIAALLGISEAASQMRLNRGLQALRGMLTEDER